MGGARVSDFFLQRNQIYFFFWGGGGWGGGWGGVDGRIDEQAKTNLPLQLRSWGHNKNVQVMALTSSIYDHFII